MKIPLNEQELTERINLNRNRLMGDSYYGIEEVFSPKDYDWYGDKEGRALLAFVSHYKINGTKIPCMEEMLEKLPLYTNSRLYFGELLGEDIHEQQLSGHSWLLRGLCEHYEQFGDEFSLRAVRSVVENLYLPIAGRYGTYPINRKGENKGGVSGNTEGKQDGWVLSSDIGCAFMSIDGLSHAYKITKDCRIEKLVREMTGVYSAIDKQALKAQTHCTLTAARGMVRMYEVTGDEYYLGCARDVFLLYVGSGMTYTYQNLNWWGRPDSWTEPCAVVDSLMLALMLYKAEGKEMYRKIAVRIYINGFASLQRDNGGAGTDSLVCPGSGEKYLYKKTYEAQFCCTMRLSEGLWFIKENSALLWGEEEEIKKTENGVYMAGDFVYGQLSPEGEKYAEKTLEIDGISLSPLLKYYKIPGCILQNIRQKILF